MIAEVLIYLIKDTADKPFGVMRVPVMRALLVMVQLMKD
ncbi:hypothetical protein JCM19232_1234 [Vibrio ishigakensis]|uniref:Uncharacterized protein n=1 Tax=Vibrio ishigakensis TaxID=1481914 RepID=A0A0B8PPC7_9VIBR|nr:hypothetical protein JCM19232_1234 [Vibrio ishigakensis]